MDIKTLTLDLETGGLDWKKDEVYLIGYRLNGQGGVVQVPCFDENEILRVALADPKVIKRGHNIKFDVMFLLKNGYEINGVLDCTSLLAYLNDPLSSSSLKECVERILKKKVTRMEDFAFRPLKKENKILEAFYNNYYYKVGLDWYRKDLMIPYNEADVTNCDELRRELPTTKWYTEVEQPLLIILMNAEIRGIQLDITYLKELETEYEEKIKEIEKGFPEINVKSTKQVSQYLQETGARLTERTDKGATKVDKMVLKRLSWNSNNSARQFLHHRELNKLLSTYVRPLTEQSDKGGRVHPSINQVGGRDSKGGTRTGRLSSSNPNIQNISKRTKEGLRIRKAFIASPGMILCESDLSQIEPRILAHYCQSPKLLKAYNNKEDLYVKLACDMFRKSENQISKIERFTAKTAFLATVYGCWYKKLKMIMETYSDEPIPYTDEDYKEIQENFWKGNPEIQSWRRQHIEHTIKLGYIDTIGGRQIKIPNLKKISPWERQDIERMIINYSIQGSASDVIKKIVVRFDKEFQQQGYGHILATVHDSVLFEMPASKYGFIEDNLSLINHIMTTTVKLNGLPIECETKIGKSWADL